MSNKQTRADRRPAVTTINTANGTEILSPTAYHPPLGTSFPELNYSPTQYTDIHEGSRAVMEIEGKLYFALAIHHSHDTTGVLFDQSGRECARICVPGRPDTTTVFNGLELRMYFGNARKLDIGAFSTKVESPSFDNPSPNFSASVKVPGLPQAYTIAGSAQAIRSEGYRVEDRNFQFFKSGEFLTATKKGKTFTLLMVNDAINKTRAVLFDGAAQVVMEQGGLTQDEATIAAAGVIPYLT
jgi:hypothetical protein